MLGRDLPTTGSSIQSSWSSNSQCIFLTNPVVLLSNLVDPPTSSGSPWPIQWFIYPIQFILLLSMLFLTNPVVHQSHLTVSEHSIVFFQTIQSFICPSWHSIGFFDQFNRISDIPSLQLVFRPNSRPSTKSKVSLTFNPVVHLYLFQLVVPSPSNVYTHPQNSDLYSHIITFNIIVLCIGSLHN